MNPVPLPEHSLRPEDYVPGRFEGRLWVEWHDRLDSTNLELMRRPSLPENEWRIKRSRTRSACP